MVNVPSFSRYVQSELSALLEDPASLGVNTAAPGDNPSTSVKILHKRWGVCTKNLRTQGQMVNYVAAVFIGALITMLQDSVVSTDSLAQPVATVSLLCALASLCWGVVLYMHVARRRHVDETHSWLFNAVRIRSMWWNVETMFTLPLVWLLWSVALFCLAFLLAYVWKLDIAVQSPILSRVSGAIAVGCWVVQVPVVVWTLVRLGQPRCATKGANRLDAVA